MGIRSLTTQFLWKLLQEQPPGPGNVLWVQAIEDMLATSPVGDTLAPPGANVRAPVSSRSLLVQSVIFISGPREDGGTGNAGNIFLGNSGVSVARGYPLLPGMTLAADKIDLGAVYWIATDASDRLRLFYVA